jgi:mRNA interferase MazF
MAIPRRGEVWQIDFGIAAKVRPAVVLTDPPGDDDLTLYTVVPHTTALRNIEWEVQIEKNFLSAGVFHVQQIQSVLAIRFQKKLGELNAAELGLIEGRLRKAFGWT